MYIYIRWLIAPIMWLFATITIATSIMNNSAAAIANINGVDIDFDYPNRAIKRVFGLKDVGLSTAETKIIANAMPAIAEFIDVVRLGAKGKSSLMVAEPRRPQKYYEGENVSFTPQLIGQWVVESDSIQFSVDYSISSGPQFAQHSDGRFYKDTYQFRFIDGYWKYTNNVGRELMMKRIQARSATRDND